MIPTSPLQLNLSAFTDVRISAQPDGDVSAKIQTKIGYNARVHAQDNRQWQVTVRVSLDQHGQTKPVYLGSVECIGLFSVSQEWPSGEIEKLVVVNGVGIIYGIIREMISNITARGAWPMITLPTQSFIAAYDQSKRTKEPSAMVTVSP